MLSLGAWYLHNLAKRAIKGEHVAQAEIVKAPKIVDKVYGDGDGDIDIDDVDDIVVNVATEVTDKASSVCDFITSWL